jgi:uncharacterized protein (DUF1330 family)
MPKGYFFVELEVTDTAAYEAYRTAVPDIIAAHGGRILVRGGDPQPLDGTVPQRRRVIVEFDRPRVGTQSAHQIMTAAKATEDAKLRESLS